LRSYVLVTISWKNSVAAAAAAAATTTTTAREERFVVGLVMRPGFHLKRIEIRGGFCVY
jgi:acetoin utilization deacetylase AcuC-like enzyme